MIKKVKIKPIEGMLVAINLSNNKFGLAQIVKVKANEKGDVIHTIWALFNVEVNEVSELSDFTKKENFLEKPILLCGMDYEELEKGKWPVLGNNSVNYTNFSLNEELVNKLQKEEIAGAYLLEMYLGIVPWNMYKDPYYLDSRLLPGYSRPANVLLK